MISIHNYAVSFCNEQLRYALFKSITFLGITAIARLWLYYCNGQLLYALLQFKTTFVFNANSTTENIFGSTTIDSLSWKSKWLTFIYNIVIDKFCVHNCNSKLFLCAITIDNIRYHCSLYTTCDRLTLWLVKLLSQLKMQNMTTEFYNNIHYNSRNNINTLKTG